MSSADQPNDLAAKAQDLVEHLLKLGINGVGPLKSARQSAEEAQSKFDSPEDAVRYLIRSHVLLAGAQGFVMNLGGAIALPVVLPANIGAAFLIQTHLAAAIAHIRGHDLDDENVRVAILVCLLGNAAGEFLKRAGIAVGEALAFAMIRRLPAQALREINKRVGFMLIAKYGVKRSLITLTKLIPLIGGLVGGGFDAAATRAVGVFAANFFHLTPPSSEPSKSDTYTTPA